MIFVGGGECPSCGSFNTDESIECVVCGRTIPLSKSQNGVCIKCLRESANVDTAVGLGWKYTDAVEVNGFLSYFFGTERINEILMNALVNSNPETMKKDAERYCFDDLDAFSAYVDEMNNEPDFSVRYIKRKGVKR